MPPRKCKADEADDQSHENKAKRRQRTGTEGTEQSATTAIPTMYYQTLLPNHKSKTTWDCIELNEELEAMHEVQIWTYTLRNIYPYKTRN